MSTIIINTDKLKKPVIIGCVKFLALWHRSGVPSPNYNSLKTQYIISRSERSDLRPVICQNRGGRGFHG